MEGLWLAAAASVPLAVNPWGANAFELPKVLLLRLLVILMAVAGLAQVLEDGSRATTARRPSGAALLGPVLLFGLSAGVTTAFSVDPRASLWGSYERQQGLLALGAYLVLSVATAMGIRRWGQVRRLLLVLVWGSAPVVAYGLVQAAGLDPLSWRSDAASPVLSTLGRSNFVGSYLVLVLPLTVGCMVLARRRWPYLLLLTSQVACLALTQARAAWVGLGVAVVVGVLAWALAARSWRLAVAAAALALLGALFVVLLNLPQGPLSPLEQLPALGRLAGLSDGETGSTAARLTTWRATMPLIAQRPLLGYGPETMRPVFARQFPPELVYYQGRHVLVDRAHNLWLDLGMSSGLAGIVCFAALVAGFGMVAWRGLRSSASQQRQVLWIALAGGVAGHLADLQFGFSLTGSTTVFWLVLGLAGALARSGAAILGTSAAGDLAHSERPDEAGVTAMPVWTGRHGLLLYLVPPAMVSLVLIGLVCVRPLLADIAYSQAGLAASQRAVRLWPLEPVYRLKLARAWMQHGTPAAGMDELEAAVTLSPDDPRVWAERGEIHALWGEAIPGGFTQASAAYRQAIDLAPNVATYHVALGLILAQQGYPAEGLVELERAVALDATDSVAYRHLAALYQALGQGAEAAWARQQAEKWERETAMP